MSSNSTTKTKNFFRPGRFRIHLIYASRDREAANILIQKFSRQLDDSGFHSVFEVTTHDAIEVGSATREASQIQDASVVLLLVSKNSLASKYCCELYDFAYFQRTVIPLILDNVDMTAVCRLYRGIDQLRWCDCKRTKDMASIGESIISSAMESYFRTLSSDDVRLAAAADPHLLLDLIAPLSGHAKPPSVEYPFMFHTFLSHTGRDASVGELTEFIAYLARWLRTRGFATPPFFLDRDWIGRWSGRPEDLKDLLNECIHRSHSTIAILSPQYVASWWCRWELCKSLSAKQSHGADAHVFYIVWERMSRWRAWWLRPLGGPLTKAKWNSSGREDLARIRAFLEHNSFDICEIVAAHIRAAAVNIPDGMTKFPSISCPADIFVSANIAELNLALVSMMKQRDLESHLACERWKATLHEMEAFLRRTTKACNELGERVATMPNFASSYPTARLKIESAKVALIEKDAGAEA